MSKFEIRPLPLERISSIRPLLEQSAHKPLRYLIYEPNVDLDEYWFDLIVDLLQNKNASIFAASRDEDVLGLLTYADNPWETAILGKRAGVINHFVVASSVLYSEHVARGLLEKIIQYAAAQGIQFLLCKPYTDATTIIHALESQGFLLMDTVVDCHYDFRRFPFREIARPSIPDDMVIRLATSNDEEALMTVARAAFQTHFGRYHADENIGQELATRFYEEWIKSSLNGYADWVCIAEAAGRIAGYSIWKKPSSLERGLNVRVAHYSIAGIHPDYSGRGLFTALTYEGMRLLDVLADIVEGPTHVNNYGVQCGYTKLHWRVCSDARISFHRWL